MMETGLKVILAIYLVIAAIFVIVSIVQAIRNKSEFNFESSFQWITFIFGIVVLSLAWVAIVTTISDRSPKRKEDMAEREQRKKDREENKQ